MKPTVGRIVHYYPRAWQREAWNLAPGAPVPAIITAVWDDACVNLHVLPDGSGTYWETSVPRFELSEGGDKEFAWDWPPRE